jgi:GntR family transcriptional regulator
VFVFRIDTHSGVPPYLQLVQQVRQAVLLGFLQPGDRLPLIREVVEDLAINPNTVAKAYRQMEQENLVTGRPGQGTFVNEQQSAAMSASTYTSLRRAYAAGLDEQAVNALFTSVHQQTRNEDVA